MTQEILAKKIGTSASTLAMLERGHRGNPSVYLMHKLASFFKVSIEDLLMGDESMTNIKTLKPSVAHQASGSLVRKYSSGKNQTNLYQVTLQQEQSFTLPIGEKQQRQLITCQSGQALIKMFQNSQLLSQGEGLETFAHIKKKIINFGPAVAAISIVTSAKNPFEFQL